MAYKLTSSGMRTFLFLIAFSLAQLVFCQDYAKVDAIVEQYPDNFSTPERLAARIEKDFSNDKEKLRAAYYWIGSRINYSLKEKGVLNYTYSSPQEKSKKHKIYTRKLSKRVLRKKLAVCEGYSQLFKKVSDEMGIPCKVVVGGAKSFVKRIGARFNSDHAWNNVSLEDGDYLIDVTWSNPENLVDKVGDYYFMTKPEDFLMSHFPDESGDALVDILITKEEFQNLPIYHNYNADDRIVVKPESALLSKSSGIINFKIIVLENNDRFSIVSSGEVIPLQDYKTEKGVVTFSVDLSNIDRIRELDLFQGIHAIASYRVIK